MWAQDSATRFLLKGRRPDKGKKLQAESEIGMAGDSLGC